MGHSWRVSGGYKGYKRMSHWSVWVSVKKFSVVSSMISDWVRRMRMVKHRRSFIFMWVWVRVEWRVGGFGCLGWEM